MKLLLEADDTETLDAIKDYKLAPYFEVVVVPAEGQRTKPKACNYGLLFARGEYTVIYDAVDPKQCATGNGCPMVTCTCNDGSFMIDSTASKYGRHSIPWYWCTAM